MTSNLRITGVPGRFRLAESVPDEGTGGGLVDCCGVSDGEAAALVASGLLEPWGGLEETPVAGVEAADPAAYLGLVEVEQRAVVRLRLPRTAARHFGVDFDIELPEAVQADDAALQELLARTRIADQRKGVAVRRAASADATATSGDPVLDVLRPVPRALATLTAAAARLKASDPALAEDCQEAAVAILALVRAVPALSQAAEAIPALAAGAAESQTRSEPRPQGAPCAPERLRPGVAGGVGNPTITMQNADTAVIADPQAAGLARLVVVQRESLDRQRAATGVLSRILEQHQRIGRPRVAVMVERTTAAADILAVAHGLLVDPTVSEFALFDVDRRQAAVVQRSPEGWTWTNLGEAGTLQIAAWDAVLEVASVFGWPTP